MLILTRKPGEKIYIGDDIIITELEGDRIGVDAPKSVAVHRSEIYDKTKKGDKDGNR